MNVDDGHIAPVTVVTDWGGGKLTREQVPASFAERFAKTRRDMQGVVSSRIEIAPKPPRKARKAQALHAIDWVPVIKASIQVEPEQPSLPPAAPSSADRKARTISMLERLIDGEDEERAQLAALMKAVLDVAGREIVIPAPIVNVTPPEPPVVNVPAPIVTVNVPEPTPRTKRVERDEMGDIVRVVEE